MFESESLLRVRARAGGRKMPHLAGLLALAVSALLFALFAARAGGSVATASQAENCPNMEVDGNTTSCTFTFTGGEQTFTVPARPDNVPPDLIITAYGARGGPGVRSSSPGGRGAVVYAERWFPDNATIYVEVGGAGVSSGAGGFNGGGSTPWPGGGGGSGGGASDVRTIPRAAKGSLNSRLLVAAGGGGAGEPGQLADPEPRPRTCVKDNEHFPPDGSPPQPSGGAGGDVGMAGGGGGPIWIGNDSSGIGCTKVTDGGSGGGAGTGSAGGAGGASGPNISWKAQAGALGQGGNGGGVLPGGPTGRAGGGGGGYYGGGGGGSGGVFMIGGTAPWGPIAAWSGSGGGGGGSNLVPAMGEDLGIAAPEDQPRVEIVYYTRPLAAPGPCEKIPDGAIIGTHGDDVLVGTTGADVIFARGGDDRIRGRGGNDHICAGPGDDTVGGGDGHDLIVAGRGNDVVMAGSGHDYVWAGLGDDLVRAGPGHDHLALGPGRDRGHGGPGDDNLIGEPKDTLIGGPGADRVVQH